MLSYSIWFSAPSFWMGRGLESRCVGRVYGADGAVPCRVFLEKLTWFAASPEIPRISRNPKVHYRTHKRPPPVPILGQPYPVHTPTSHILEIYPNIIHPSTPRSPQWSPSLRFPHQDSIHPRLLTHTRHMPSSSHSSRFYHPHNIG